MDSNGKAMDARPVNVNTRPAGDTGLNRFSWLDRFRLQKNPFRDTLDTDLFYRTRQHEEAVVKIRIGIEDRHALILLAGDSGTGKTVVSQVALRSLEQTSVCPVFIFVYPGLGRGALLAAILKELEVDNVGRATSDRLRQLQEKALALHARKRRLVIVIDEAHFLKADALHLLRTLSNLETEEEKLVTVLLIGEASLVRRLNGPSYAALRGRITFSLELAPLTLEETEQYVKYRLLKCRMDSGLVPSGTYPVLHARTNGVPREINKLLYKALLDTALAASLDIAP